MKSQQFKLPAILGIWLATIMIAFWLGGRDLASAPESDEMEAHSKSSSRSHGRGAARQAPGLPVEGTRAGMKVVFAQQAEGLGLEEVQEALKNLPNPRNPSQVDWHRALVHRWAVIAPKGAMAYANGVTHPKLRYDSQGEVLEEWARSNPAEAWDHVTENPDGSLSNDMYDHILEGVGRADPVIAFQFAKEHEEALLAEDYSVDMIVSGLYENGSAEDVVDGIGGLPVGPLREAVSSALVGEWARYDPEAALAWIDGSHTKDGQNEDSGGEFYRLLAKGWGRVDPMKAMEWVGTLPAGTDSEGHRKEIFSTWMRVDADNAAQWLVEQPQSESNDQLIDHYTRVVVDRDPEVTMLWADSIVDPERRKAVQQRVAYFWEELDPAGWEAHQKAKSEADGQ